MSPISLLLSYKWKKYNVLFPLSLLWFKNIVDVFIQDMSVLCPLKSLWLKFVVNVARFPLTSLHFKCDLWQVIHKVEGPPPQSPHWG